MSILEKNRAALLAAAADVNFYGKRKKDTRLEAAEDILRDLELWRVIDAGDLAEWLQANKPQKPAAQRAASNKPAANTKIEGLAAPEKLPALELGREQSGFLVTCAQNNTGLHPDFTALENFAVEAGLQLVVLPVWYNKNAFSAVVEDEKERFEWPRMQMEDCTLFGDIVLRPSAAINPTAKRPENAAKDLNSGELATIVASPKQHLLTLPRAPGQPIKEAWSTGAITAINYTRSRAGRTAEKAHKVGGVIVQMGIDGIKTRNVEVRGGKVFDRYHAMPEQRPAMVLGDLHSEMKCPTTWSQTLHMVSAVEPCLVAVHDILHFSTKSHHNRNDGLHLYKTQNDTVLNDLHRVINDLNELASLVPLVYVVESNHNSALDNWLHDISYNPKRDPRQAKIYYLLNYLVCEAIDNDDKESNALQVAFEHLDSFEQLPALAENVEFGSMKKAYYAYGVDLSQHGHKGQNGSGGNTNLFSQWGLPMVTGHTHSPAIVGDVLTVGVTASLDQGYNAGGASSWRQSHGLVFPNGAKQMLHVYGLCR